MLKINIINFEYIVVDANKRKLIIKSCRNLKIKLKINSKNNIKIKRIIKIKRSLVIVVYFILKVLIIIQNNILSNKNYIFKSILFNAYFYIVDKNIFFVCVRNNCLTFFYILQYVTLKHLLEFKKQNYY